MSALQGYTGGYPYLRIARHYGLDYGDVLNWGSPDFGRNHPAVTNVKKQLNINQQDQFADDVIAAVGHFRRLSRGEIRADGPFA